MKEMIHRFLRQKLGNVGIVLVLIAVALLTVPSFIAGSGGPPVLAVLLVSAGAVSRDISSGTVQMILARPVRRSEYVLGRYLGILALLAAFLVFAIALTVIFQEGFNAVFGSHRDVPPGILLQTAAGEWLDGALLAATLIFFSTFLPGVGDLLAYFLLMIGLGVAGSLGQRFPGLARGARLVSENLMPDVPWGEVFRGDLGSAAFGRWILALTAFLAAAIFVFSRREFSYGHD